ncbi:non-homologous end joining protein Ku [Saccharothrix sp. ST-888]|uniref:non-homologous end joining protein Ku n=1 Tax=Saccharothrix sp. ST-888 TaxID=1427391 RepID=UPI0005EBF895|nr:Ku protein [Saccharothrix sp. ST-888]KJK56388.1 DNA repair protein [Saccharothrix sp. ST-888]
MARPIWTGTLSFGLVAVPVGLYAATEDHSPHFRQLERGTSDRVRNLRVNERTGKEVAYGDIVKGYEVAEGEYVVFEPSELEDLSPGRSRSIEISGFVRLQEVDPIFFDRTYYLGPRGKEYANVYGLLLRAMTETGRAGLATFSMRGKQYLAAVRPEADLLVLQTMHYAEEVRDPHREVDNLPGEVAPGERELATACQLIEALSVDWEPDAYHDTYGEQVRDLVEAKLTGRETVAAAPAPESTNVVDLMDVLQRSLRQAGSGEDKGEQRPEAKPKAATAERASAVRNAPAAETAPAAKKAGAAKKAPAGQDLSALGKTELYRMATDQGIQGRSTMTRDQLQHALEEAARPRRRLRAVS